ncbi:MAG: UDP-N-acetylmuramate dehydrogenase [Anaerolineaceae bacterium]
MLETDLKRLQECFGDRLQENVQMKNYTTMQIGGFADALLIAQDAQELETFTKHVWELELPLLVLGGGSNILVSDAGIRGIVIINHAHNISIHSDQDSVQVTAESGALMSKVARQAINRLLSGLEWAATLPGTVGGAVYGNAGCFGKETADNFIQAEILHRKQGKVMYGKEAMAFEYRSSILKHNSDECVVLTASFSAQPGDYDQMIQKIETYKERRQKTQPPGPSMGSIFRNPQAEKAGKLIEAAGLKGKKCGGAEISDYHANFIINTSNGSAQDVWDLIQTIENTVHQKFGFFLHTEIQLVGDWNAKILQEFEKYQTIQENV